MVRAAGLAYTMTPGAAMGSRIGDLRVNGRPLEAGRRYKVAGWAPVAEEARHLPNVRPVWELVETWLKGQAGRVPTRRVQSPRLLGVEGNAGITATGSRRSP